mmetsp:Transcript_27524/g.67962  ORF Transcript_27524/g.67962 Transcript_27524/m.67962 type:complete len:328 (+) Transcript_27524:71-1054(+)
MARRLLSSLALQASKPCLAQRRATPPSFLRMATTPGPSKSKDAIVVGCVSYCDYIGDIWTGIAERFKSRGVPLDFVLFTNYDRQIESLLNGHIDIAWNGPVSHVRIQRRTNNTSISLGMRDTDQDFPSVVIASTRSGVTSLQGLVGKQIAAGTFDSPQAYILPLHYISKTVPLKELDVVRFDRDVGKHGDTGIGEEEVIKAVAAGRADVGLLSKMMLDRAVAAGTLKEGDFTVVAQVESYDHCQFDALGTLPEAKKEAFLSALFAMDWENPEDRPIMQKEGITRRWAETREEGYNTTREAIADEPNVPFPPCMHPEDAHPFKSLTVL